MRERDAFAKEARLQSKLSKGKGRWVLLIAFAQRSHTHQHLFSAGGQLWGAPGKGLLLQRPGVLVFTNKTKSLACPETCSSTLCRSEVN